MRALVISILTMLFTVGPARAGFPPDRATNLQVLPKTISMSSLISVMGGFTRALGVRCSHCHVQREGQTFEQIEFALDDNPRKGTAREMLRMVAAINGDHLSRLKNRRQPAIEVTCATCHRGVAEPRPLRQLVFTAYVVAGSDSAEAVYRALRSRYYGSGSYDFDEVSLADVADSIRARGPLQDAIRFHTLNAQMNPQSTFALRQLARMQLAANDTAAAISAYERALGINANDAQSQGALRALRRGR